MGIDAINEVSVVFPVSPSRPTTMAMKALLVKLNAGFLKYLISLT